MKYITILLGAFGGFCWILAYVFIIYRGIKDKSYGMPLIPLVLNFGYEFVYSFCYPVNQLFNLPWVLLDLGIIYTYFKYGFPYFKKFYLIEKKQWYIMSVFAFIIGFLINFFGYQFFSENLNYIPNEHISVIFGFIWVLFISVCMITMLFQRKNIEGQSFLISLLIFLGTFSYVLQIATSSVFNHCVSNPLMILVITVSICIQFYYTISVYKHSIKLGINPLKRL